MWLTPDTEVIDRRNTAGCHSAIYGFCRVEMHNDIYDTDFSCIIEGYIFDAW